MSQINEVKKTGLISREMLGWFSGAFTPEQLQSWGQKTGYRVFSFSETEAVRGLLLTMVAEGEVEIIDIGIDPLYRGKGIGRLFLGEMLTRWKLEGMTKVFLEVRPSNVVANRLYVKCGFDTVGVRKNYYSNPTEDAVVMRRELI